MADEFARIFSQLQDLMCHAQCGTDQDRQLGNMWDFSSLLVLNLIHFADQKIRHLPGPSSFDIGLERVRLPEKLYGDKLFQ